MIWGNIHWGMVATGVLGFGALRWIANQNDNVHLEPQYRGIVKNVRIYSWFLLIMCLGIAVYSGWSA